MKSPISAAIAIVIGLVVLAGYFLKIPALVSARTLLLSWAVIIAAIATWIGVINLFSVHVKKISTHKPDAPYSIVFILAFFLTLGLGIAGMILPQPQSQLSQVVTAVQVPVEASLFAILTVTLVLASIRLLNRRHDPMSILFLVAIVVFLILSSGLLPLVNIPALTQISAALNRLPLAGARGILLGVALGSLTTGLRIIIGADRPYGG